MATSADVPLHTPKRITDVVKGPGRMLLPIAGYQDKPLVTLEEAVIPLVDQLPLVQTYVEVAKLNSKPDPVNRLTVDETASIMLYTMDWDPQNECLYVALNDTLRTEDRRKLKPWFSYLKLFLTALFKLPSSTRRVYRGVKMNLGNAYKKEEKFIWWGFSSCASSAEVLEGDEFLGKTGVRTLFTIECTSGKDISRYSYFEKEAETLLLPARQFQVVASLSLGNDLHMVELKELESRYLVPPGGPQITPTSKDFTVDIVSV